MVIAVFIKSSKISSMHSPNFSLQEARQIDLIDYLQLLGLQPEKIRNNDYWYLSPLREEKEPSFKVNRRLNVWYDHGRGQGGNIIDFGMLYYNCSFKEVMKKLQDTFSFHPQTPTVQQHLANTQSGRDAVEPKIKVIAAKPLSNLFLCSYLRQRKIPFQIAKNYCEEVHYELNGKPFFAIGFKNNLGGYELRNRHFKGSSSPKDVTFIQNSSAKIETASAKEVAVFEGFLSFLSYKTLQEKSASLTNYLILNSLSFFEKSRSLLEKHERINLYLDQDQAGKTCTQKALKWSKKYIDQSHRYKDHKDVNDYLVRRSQEVKQGFRHQRFVGS